MTRWIALLFFALTVSGVWTTVGVAQQAVKPRVVAANSLDPVKGRFHQRHARKLKMTCGNCHGAGQPDVLFLRGNDVVSAAMPGPVNRAICLPCHQVPNKPAWYGAVR
jgi:hypothetical protein